MKERILQLIELFNMTPTQFAQSVGIQRATLQHILSGRNEPSLKIVMAIHNAFPDIELEWLLYGKGMAIPQLQSQNDKVETKNETYPILPGMESEFFKPQVEAKTEYSNLREINKPTSPIKKSGNKELNNAKSKLESQSQRRVKEIILFFEDGTYQKIMG